MTSRERIINTVLCKPVDRLPFTFYFGPWGETIYEWQQSGDLPPETEWSTGCGFDPGFMIVDVNLGYSPSFEHQVIEEKENTMIIKDTLGIIQEVNKVGASIPRYIEYPVKNREDWEKLKLER